MSDLLLFFILNVCLNEVYQFIRFLFAEFPVTEKSIHKRGKRPSEAPLNNMLALTGKYLIPLSDDGHDRIGVPYYILIAELL